MKCIHILTILILSAPLAHAQTYRCGGALNDGEGEVIQICNINYLDLARDPEKYDGRYLIVRGFVARDGPRMLLFASRDLYIYGGGMSGIALQSEESMNYLQEQADKEKPTTIRGRFYVNQRRTLNGVLGRIELSEGGAWSTNLPGQPPEPPPSNNGA